MSRVALVIVSHSRELASGVRSLAAAMAPDVHIGVAGGLEDGGLGTSFDLVDSAAQAALVASEGAGVVFLTDLGSATLTVDTVLEFADDPDVVVFAPGPLVEGAVAAAVSAQQGEKIGAVAHAVTDAGRQWCGGEDAGGVESEELPDAQPLPDATAEAVVADKAGLHARPAAALAQLASSFEAETYINGAFARSIMEIVGQGVRHGDKVIISASGSDAAAAVNAIADAISTGLD